MINQEKIVKILNKSPNQYNVRPTVKSKTSVIATVKKNIIMKKYPSPLEQLHKWLFERAATELVNSKKNDEKVKWLKFACLIKNLSK